jgi:hypothetical protein
MIKFSSVSQQKDLSPSLLIDEYIPLSFRSYSGLLGARYLRVGNFQTSLLEFILDPISAMVRGVTLVMFDSFYMPNESALLLVEEGLPIIDLEQSQVSILAPNEHLEINHQFSVGLRDDIFEIDLFGIAKAERVVCCDRFEFLLNKDTILGLRMIDLNENEISMLKGYFPRQ